MSTRARDEAEPLGTALHEADGYARLSFLSRGERVHGRLYAARVADAPLLLVAGTDGSTNCSWSIALVDACVGWAAVATIDLPLCGSRSSEKLSELAFDPANELGRRLRPEISRQAACDLRATISALRDAAGVRTERIGLAAAGHGAALVTAFCREPKQLDALALCETEDARELAEALGPERARIFATDAEPAALATFLRARLTA